jgi:Ca-activated chloride channel family protein
MVDVIKDASATIYGTRVSNSIIIISAQQYKVWLKELKELDVGEHRTPNQEDYESFVETNLNHQSAPLSTFSIDVDNASYTNIRHMINDQTGPKMPLWGGDRHHYLQLSYERRPFFDQYRIQQLCQVKTPIIENQVARKKQPDDCKRPTWFSWCFRIHEL